MIFDSFFLKIKQSNNLKNLLIVIPIAIILPIIILASTPKVIHSENNLIKTEDSVLSLSLVFAGDAMAHMPQIDAAYDANTKSYCFNEVFKEIKPYVSAFDFALINFETTTAGSGFSGYPQFCVPDTFVYALKNAGFDFFVNANNHSCDKGKIGIERSIDVFNRFDVPHTGTFKNKLERDSIYPFILNFKQFKIAILNYTYGTNGIPAPAPNIVNLIDTIQIKKDLQKAKDSLPDLIIVAMHWGTEYQRTPNNEQKVLADFLIANNTDIVVGSHPHVIQPYEIRTYKRDSIIKNALVIWSLGNFVSNQRKPYTDGGLMVSVNVEKNKFTKNVKIFDAKHIPFWVYKSANPTNYVVLPIEKYENDTTLNLNELDKASFKKFIKDTREHLVSGVEFKLDTIKVMNK